MWTGNSKSGTFIVQSLIPDVILHFLSADFSDYPHLKMDLECALVRAILSQYFGNVHNQSTSADFLRGPVMTSISSFKAIHNFQVVFLLRETVQSAHLGIYAYLFSSLLRAVSM